jgi:hypothetical protein
MARLLERSPNVSQLRSFAPWIAYPVATAVFDWRVGSAVALALCLAGLARAGRARAIDVFSIAAAFFFAGLATVAFADPTSGLHRFVPALTPGTLALAAGVSIVVGRPFTVPFAKRVAPPEFWDTPMFMHINNVVSAVWAASFAVTASIIAVVVATAPHAVAILIWVQIAGFLVPMRISRRYPAAVRARHIAPA